MSQWYCKAMGDGVEAFAPATRLHEAFFALAKASGVPRHAAVFSRYDLEANVVTWYFSPEAVTLATTLGAAPCDKPTPSQGFGLLSGDVRAWEAHFPGYVRGQRRSEF